jgi:hypothetical protein
VSRALTLEVGKTYFSVFYADEKLLHPVFETLIYLGPEIGEDEKSASLHLFQYAESFHSDGNWKDMTADERQEFAEPPLITYEAAHIDPIVDADGLIEELAKWKARSS